MKTQNENELHHNAAALWAKTFTKQDLYLLFNWLSSSISGTWEKLDSHKLQEELFRIVTEVLTLKTNASTRILDYDYDITLPPPSSFTKRNKISTITADTPICLSQVQVVRWEVDTDDPEKKVKKVLDTPAQYMTAREIDFIE